MTIHEHYGLTRIINAAGTYTPLGVSRSSDSVGAAVGEALGDFFVIDELQRAVSTAISDQTSADAATVTHCVAAGITVAVAAAMTGDDEEQVARLPDTTGLPNRVVIPAGHVVNYGHSIVTDIRLAGAEPVVAGTTTNCSVDDIERAIMHERTACLLLVSSRLVKGPPIDLAEAVALAHDKHVTAIIDGAAQDMRLEALLASGADIVLVSAHKYMASPTAGLVIGRKSFVAACRAQEHGIGRAMKATKESLVGVLAALEQREHQDMDAWRSEQTRKVLWFIEQASALDGIARAIALPDPAGMPFARVCLTIDSSRQPSTASIVAQSLANGSPSIRVMKQVMDDGTLLFELVPLTQAELAVIIERLEFVLASVKIKGEG